jgi:hypothetical protein
MKKLRNSQVISIQSIRRANERLKSNGIAIRGRRSISGTMSVNVVRGTLNLHKVVSREEISNAYKNALIGNA